MSKVTAGRDALGGVCPEFAHLNDDILSARGGRGSKSFPRETEVL